MAERSTKKQKELLDFVDEFIAQHGYGPSYREIMKAMDYKSVSTVAIHIDGLIAKGYLRKRDNSARSLEVVSANFRPDAKIATTGSAKEKWLVDAINDRFTEYESKKSQQLLDELYVLIGALKILGLDEAHEAAKSRLFKTQK